MNFGNFLFGLSGEAQGFTLFELASGAQYNSLANTVENNYVSQLDSPDDQMSIGKGFLYGKVNSYDRKLFKAEAGTSTTPITPTTRGSDNEKEKEK